MSYWTKHRKVNKEWERMKLKLYQQSNETNFVEHLHLNYSTAFDESLSDDGAVGINGVPFFILY